MADDSPRCKAKTRSGRRCKNPPIQGAVVCRMHGGAAPQVKAAAKKRVDEERIRRLAEMALQQVGTPEDYSPEQVILDEIARASGVVAALGQMVHHRYDEDGPAGLISITAAGVDPDVLYAMWVAERKHLATIADRAIRAGIEQKRVDLAQEHGQKLAAAIRGVLDGLELTPEQAARVPDLLRAQLATLTA